MKNHDEVLDYMEEYVSPDKYLASTGDRFLNYIIDRIGAFCFIFLLGPMIADVRDYSSTMKSFDLFLLMFLFLGYWVLFEFFLGKTPGKYLTRTKVVTTYGDKPSLLQIIGRTLCRFIPFEQFSFLGQNAIGWHDSISNTRVVKDYYGQIETNTY